MKTRYDLLGFGARASFYGQLVMVSLARQKTVAIGEIAPDFVVKKWEGDTISLRAIKRKVKLLHFREKHSALVVAGRGKPDCRQGFARR